MINNIPNPLADFLKSYCNVNALSINDLAYDLQNSIKPRIAKKFKEQFANAIMKGTITPKIYEELTGEDFDTQKDLEKRLNELWVQIFDDEPIPKEPSENGKR